MPVIDVHVHIYPDKIAVKAAEAVGQFYNVAMKEADGSVGRLLESLEPSPITHCVVHSVATKPAHVRSINDFIAATCAEHPNFIGFMTMHQDCPDPEAEIDHAMELGLRGIKLHPDTQEVNLDDPRLMAVYEIAEARHLPLIIHTGDYRYDFSHPRRLVHVMRAFPGLVVDAAHLGGWSIYDLALEYLEHERCFLDVSSSMSFLGPRRTRELVRLYGAERVLFGSDFPMWNPADEYACFASMGFTDEEMELMTWKNAQRFLGMEVDC